MLGGPDGASRFEQDSVAADLAGRAGDFAPQRSGHLPDPLIRAPTHFIRCSRKVARIAAVDGRHGFARESVPGRRYEMGVGVDSLFLHVWHSQFWKGVLIRLSRAKVTGRSLPRLLARRDSKQ